ncbi:hypothetical protein [Methylobacterium sp. WL19]|uniref:hypothetical protein n=1 Tax=Methylobacterium sp. WL19 TaxID=2603896 RepID=UPI0011C9E423|nr:hypothetical protein [Methylobacterium sp. WL19]TXN25558.1 hypothetical protein FV220_18250 [Methylobacterium sp. WL19]
MSALTASENPKTIFRAPARQFKLLARFVQKPGLRITQLREVTVLTTSEISELHFSQAVPPFKPPARLILKAGMWTAEIWRVQSS